VPAVADIAARHAAIQAGIARRAAADAARLWAEIDPNHIAPSWLARLPRAYAGLSASQTAAAGLADSYTDRVLGTRDAAARVVPAGFAGVASDGRPLMTLLQQPVFTTLRQITGGTSPARALASGRYLLDMIVRTQVADAGRTAVGAAITARPHAAGYVRQVVGNTCARCLILAGRHYRWNAGFKRHPRCDCIHIPTAENVPGDIATSPRAAFDAMSPTEQDRVFGQAGAQAIRDGADMAQVVNARRGMQTASVFGRDVLVTTEGTTTRGIAGNRLGARFTAEKSAQDRYRRATNVRLMPEEIYREAGADRAEAVRLLRLHGYLI
jgi:hypothetical protein